MKTSVICVLLWIFFGFLTPALAQTTSLSWWFLPDMMEELPHEMEEDTMGYWTELWVRPTTDTATSPRTVMEQALGARWMGLTATGGKINRPTRFIVVLNSKRVVDADGEKIRWGTLGADEKVSWNDGSKQALVEFKKRRGGGRSRRGKRARTRVSFGKISLPAVALKESALQSDSLSGIEDFLNRMVEAPSVAPTENDYALINRLSDPNGTLFNFRFAPDCKEAARHRIEEALTRSVVPKLTCWAEQNPENLGVLAAALMQHPQISCRPRSPMDNKTCGMASVPLTGSFFVRQPYIVMNTEACPGETASTLLHEILHLAGVHDADEKMDKAVMESESCSSMAASVSFENAGEPFVNDLQVETRMAVFRRVRDEAVEKWGWTEGEKAFLLGTVCTKMGDRNCARKFFTQATEAGLDGMVELPEGTQVSFKSLIAFNTFDSISEDLQRMRELVRYLKYDPTGALLRRLETGSHRSHEFHLARNALESLQKNKGVCNDTVDERIYCEDLAQIVKSPWFRN